MPNCGMLFSETPHGDSRGPGPKFVHGDHRLLVSFLFQIIHRKYLMYVSWDFAGWHGAWPMVGLGMRA